MWFHFAIPLDVSWAINPVSCLSICLILWLSQFKINVNTQHLEERHSALSCGNAGGVILKSASLILVSSPLLILLPVAVCHMLTKESKTVFQLFCHYPNECHCVACDISHLCHRLFNNLNLIIMSSGITGFDFRWNAKNIIILLPFLAIYFLYHIASSVFSMDSSTCCIGN